MFDSELGDGCGGRCGGAVAAAAHPGPAALLH